MSYCISDHLLNKRSIVFAEVMSLVLQGVDCRMHQGEVMAATHELFVEGKTLDGAEPAGYELGQWKGRFMCTDEPRIPVDGETYFAWVSSDFWDFDPNLVFFTKLEFMNLFEDCCRNFVNDTKSLSWYNKKPINRSEEFSKALAAHGMCL